MSMNTQGLTAEEKAFLDEIRALEQKATKGPWTATHCEYGCGAIGGKCPLGKKTEDQDCLKCDDVNIYQGACVDDIKTIEYWGITLTNDDDADFCAASRTAIPRLLSIIERQSEQLEKFEQLLADEKREKEAAVRDLYALQNGDGISEPLACELCDGFSGNGGKCEGTTKNFCRREGWTWRGVADNKEGDHEV